MKKCLLFLAVFICMMLGCALPAAADEMPDIRVLIGTSSSNSAPEVTIYQGTYRIVPATDPSVTLATLERGDKVTYAGPTSANGFSYDGSLILVVPENEEEGLFRYNGKTYRGTFRFVYRNDYYYSINVLNVEQYLYGVVGQEIGYTFDDDALMAQAVTARSYAIASCNPSRAYDVTATTSSQVYGGYSAEQPQIIEAVDATHGWVVKYGNKMVITYFAASAGGHTENVENIWLSDEIPIRGVDSSYDAKSPTYGSYAASCWNWTKTMTPAQLVAAANRYGNTDIGSFKGITMSTTYKGQTSVSGRAMIVTIEGTKGSVSATKDNIRSLLGINSTLIEISDQTGLSGAAMQDVYVMGENGVATLFSDLGKLFASKGLGAELAGGANADSFYAVTADGVVEISKQGAGSLSSPGNVVITGWGNGHGVGMSQWGAIAMADDGWTWQEIVEHYYCHAGITLEQEYDWPEEEPVEEAAEDEVAESTL